MMKKNKKGQSTLEYAILIIIIIAALLSLQTYVKRGVSGRLKSSADDIGDQYVDGGNYYKKTTSSSNTYNNNVGGTTQTGLVAGTIAHTNVISNQSFNTRFFFVPGAYVKKFWFEQRPDRQRRICGGVHFDDRRRGGDVHLRPARAAGPGA